MKTEADVLDLVQRVYARIGGQHTDLVRVKPHYGGWLNTLQYDVIRADGAVATIRRKHVDDGNFDALAAELGTFAAPGTRTRLCGQCGKWMPESARYCQACGNRLEHASGRVPPRTSATAPSRRLPKKATLIVTAIICAVGTLAYAVLSRTLPRDAALMQRSVGPEASDAAVSGRSLPNPADPSAGEARAGPVGGQSVEAASATEPKNSVGPDARTTAAPGEAASGPPESAPPKAVSNRSRAHLSSGAEKRGAVRRHSTRIERHSIDHAFKRISAAECSAGFAGVLCREKLRFRLCKERWTEHHVPGQSVCHVVAYGGRAP